MMCEKLAWHAAVSPQRCHNGALREEQHVGDSSSESLHMLCRILQGATSFKHSALQEPKRGGIVHGIHEFSEVWAGLVLFCFRRVNFALSVYLRVAQQKCAGSPPHDGRQLFMVCFSGTVPH